MKSSSQTKGKLYLIPNLISETAKHVNEEIILTIKETKYYLAETPKQARRFLKKIMPNIHLESMSIEQYNKDTLPEDLDNLMQPLLQGFDLAIITDSGMPGIADPGNSAVAVAHRWGVKVKPLVGPTSLMLALSASGLTGQRFCFHGYLPIRDKDCISAIRNLESTSVKNNYSQIFIETPYRNEKLFNQLIRTLQPDTRLCLGYDITGMNEAITTKTVAEWRKKPFKFQKLPCVFIIYSGN